MDVSLALQYAIIAVAVVVSAWVVLKKQFPGPLRKARVALALPLLREDRAGWVRVLGRWIAPPGLTTGGKACGGCDGCG
ncbi:DUF6587 family protein [Pseudoxanthomonas sp. PXM01]|uniref:DUF6587 family protein n=1 Tax=Pseudoxanthomonas sp. PXM01 TaxID=2769295 RepID=UPI0017842259|nr:DUF6587 family protein [Pseudoxanthomonas sp. PXM01]MBD9468022.1 hypothetical protein [Pseudoxanthomonas sp. PXM01]